MSCSKTEKDLLRDERPTAKDAEGIEKPCCFICLARDAESCYWHGEQVAVEFYGKDPSVSLLFHNFVARATIQAPTWGGDCRRASQEQPPLRRELP